MRKLQLSRALEMPYSEIDDILAVELDVLMAYIDGESHGQRLKADAESKRRANG